MPRRGSSSRSSSSSERRGSCSKRRGSVTPCSPSSTTASSGDTGRFSSDEEDRSRKRWSNRRRSNRRSDRSDVVSNACRYTQAAVTSGNRGISGPTCVRQLHVDFDAQHRVWHLVAPATRSASGGKRPASGPAKHPQGETRRDVYTAGSRFSDNESSSNGSDAAGPVDLLGKPPPVSTNRIAGSTKNGGGAFTTESVKDSMEGDDGTQSSASYKRRSYEFDKEKQPPAAEKEKLAPEIGRQAVVAATRDLASSRDNTDNDRTVKISPSDVQQERLGSDAGTPGSASATPRSGDMRRGTLAEESSRATQDGELKTAKVATGISPQAATDFGSAVKPENAEDMAGDASTAVGPRVGHNESAGVDSERGGPCADPDGDMVNAFERPHETEGAGHEGRGRTQGREMTMDEEAERDREGGAGEGELQEKGKAEGSAQPTTLGSKETVPCDNLESGHPTKAAQEAPGTPVRGQNILAVAGAPAKEESGRSDGLSPQAGGEAVRVTWRGQPVALAGSIVVTLKETRPGEPYLRRENEGDKTCGRQAEGRLEGCNSRHGVGKGKDELRRESVDGFSSEDEDSDAAPLRARERKGRSARHRAAEGINGEGNGKAPRGGDGKGHGSPSRQTAPRSTRHGDVEAANIGGRRPRDPHADPAAHTVGEEKHEEVCPSSHRRDGNSSPRQQLREEALPLARPDPSAAPPTTARGENGTLSRLARPAFFLPEPYLGPPVAIYPRAWPPGTNVMTDSTADSRRRSRRRGRGAKRSGGESHGGGGARIRRGRGGRGRSVKRGESRRASERKGSGSSGGGSEGSTSISGSTSSVSRSSRDSHCSRHAGVSREEEGKYEGEEAKGHPTRPHRERTVYERRTRRDSSRNSERRASVLGEEKCGSSR